jgi:hypothetical protein
MPIPNQAPDQDAGQRRQRDYPCAVRGRRQGGLHPEGFSIPSPSIASRQQRRAPNLDEALPALPPAPATLVDEANGEQQPQRRCNLRRCPKFLPCKQRVAP